MISFSKQLNRLTNLVLIICLFAFLFSACSNPTMPPKIIGLEELQSSYNGDAKLYVVNFWATWCKPCIEELPYFDKMHDKYADEGVEFLLVSLDFAKDYDTKLMPFLKDNPQKLPIVLLDAGKPKHWIDKINPAWGGAIPATIITSKNLENTFFKEGELSLSELDQAIQNSLKSLNQK